MGCNLIYPPSDSGAGQALARQCYYIPPAQRILGPSCPDLPRTAPLITDKKSFIPLAPAPHPPCPLQTTSKSSAAPSPVEERLLCVSPLVPAPLRDSRRPEIDRPRRRRQHPRLAQRQHPPAASGDLLAQPRPRALRRQGQGARRPQPRSPTSFSLTSAPGKVRRTRRRRQHPHPVARPRSGTRPRGPSPDRVHRLRPHRQRHRLRTHGDRGGPKGIGDHRTSFPLICPSAVLPAPVSCSAWEDASAEVAGVGTFC